MTTEPVQQHRMHAPERRQQLLEVSEAVITRAGPGVSMAEIAAAAGVTKPVLYRHFGGKTGLFHALAQRHIGAIRESIRDALRGDGDVRARTCAAIEAYLSYIDEHPTVYRLTTRADEINAPEIGMLVHRFVDALGEELSEIITDDYGIAETEANTWGHAIVGMVYHSGDHWMHARHVGRHAMAVQLTDLLWGRYGQLGDLFNRL